MEMSTGAGSRSDFFKVPLVFLFADSAACAPVDTLAHVNRKSRQRAGMPPGGRLRPRFSPPLSAYPSLNSEN